MTNLPLAKHRPGVFRTIRAFRWNLTTASLLCLAVAGCQAPMNSPRADSSTGGFGSRTMGALSQLNPKRLWSDKSSDAETDSTVATASADESSDSSPGGMFSKLRPVKVLPNLKPPIDGSQLKSGQTAQDDVNIDGVQGPLQRAMQGKLRRNATPQDSKKSQQSLAAFKQAQRLFNDGQYKAAEKILKKITKRNQPLFASRKDKELLKRQYDPIREEALYLIAETQFAQKRYAWAQDSYVALMKDYPSTRYLDRSTRRLFEIARTWLGAPDFATTGDIQQVNLEDPRSTPAAKTTKPPHGWTIIPNFFDRTRPVFDTQGRAIQALKSIWLNDPTGPLADDALMMTASHYLRKGDYQEADRVFNILREEYPKSQHLQAAFLLGSHVKLMSYQGAGYDITQLEAARQLKASTLRLFPDLPAKERLKGELKRIEEAKAQRDWETAQLYLRKNKLPSVAVYCNEILRRFPNTSYAKRAKDLLKELGPEYSSGRWKLHSEHGQPKVGNESSPERLQPGIDNNSPGRAQL